MIVTAKAALAQTHLLSISEPQVSSWRFNYSSPAPHYFSSVHGVLKQWPQIWFPTGHIVAAVELPAFTKLYHGRKDSEIPPNPEWLALDM
jgi:hypothetical protein